MRSIGLLLLGFFFWQCSDDTSLPENHGQNRLSIAVRGGEDLADFIGSLKIYAFRSDGTEDYVFYRMLADLDKQAIRNLQQAGVSGENATKPRLLNVELPVGDYRLYLIGNTGPAPGVPLEEGITRPEAVYLKYPEDGLYWSYFLGSSFLSVGESARNVPVELDRVVSRVFLKIQGIPEAIDTIRISVENIAGQVSLEKEYSGAVSTPEETFQIKHDPQFLYDTLLFDAFTFPSVEGSSVLKLLFYAKSGEIREKKIPLQLLPDRYVYMTAGIDHAWGALLSFEFTFLYFFAWDWRNMVLPDFSLKAEEI